MAILNSVPLPLGDPISQTKRPQYGRGPDPLEGTLTQPWIDYLSGQAQRLDDSPVRIAHVPLLAQTASISATSINTAPLSAGLYQILFYLRLEKVDSLSASVSVTFRFTWNSAARTAPSGTLGANQLFQTVSNPLPLIAVDANTNVTYETTAAFGSGDGVYALDIVLSQVKLGAV